VKHPVVTAAVLRDCIERDADRCETIRAALELAGVPFDEATCRGLRDLAVTYERVLDTLDRERE